MIGMILNKNIIWTTLIVVLFFAYFLLCDQKSSNKNNNIKALVIVILISFILGNVCIKIYESIYNDEIDKYNNVTAEIQGTVYYELDEGTYLIKDVAINNSRIKSNLRVSGKKLNYGDRIKATATLKIPNKARNKDGFNYQQYLKTQKIYLTGTLLETKIIAKNQNNILEETIEKIRKKVREFTENTVDIELSGILEALITGDDRKINEEIEEEYKKAGMIHLLVVSGGHIAFLILLINYILNIVNIGKKKSNYILIIIIIIYMFITGLSPSVLRAGIASIIVLIANIIGRENDTLTTIGVVALILMIENPNIVYSLSFQLSFLGTIGIVLGYPKLSKVTKKLPKNIVEPVSLTLSAQLFVTPITLYNFNTIYLGGLISNVFSMSLAGIIMMIGIVLFPVYLLLPPLANFLMPAVELMIRLMNIIAKVFSNIPLLNLTLPTPSIYQIIIYYIVLFYFLDIDIKMLIKSEKIRINLPVLYKKNIYKKRVVLIWGILSILIVSFISKTLPQPLEIAMLDVGHGDSILITTPHKNTILIDTGDSYSYDGKTYDSGERTVVPYILDQGYRKIDLLILSHLDSDHIGGLEAVSKSLKINNIGLSINSNKKEGISKIQEIIKKEKAKTIYLSKNQEFNIDGVNFKILLPAKKERIEDENNDSIVILMEYQGIKTLFMGDLEKEGEQELIKNNKDLDIDILKIGHHGSITSTTKELIEATTPKVALISVGTRFKSIPSNEVLDRLGSVYSKVYRTDKMGQITLKIKNRKIYSETIY